MNIVSSGLTIPLRSCQKLQLKFNKVEFQVSYLNYFLNIDCLL